MSSESHHSEGSILPSLISASSSGDLTLVTHLLSKWQTSSNPVPPRGSKATTHYIQPALEAAIRADHQSIITYLLDQDFRITDVIVKTAVKTRSTAVLELLLQHGWDINNRWSPYKMPAICTAITHNDQTLIEWFLTHGASPHLHHTPYTSFTPLTYAAIYASPAIMKLLVEHGGRVQYGNLLSALSQSTLPGRLSLLDYLIQQGATLDQLDESHNERRFRMFARRFEFGTPLHAAVRNNRVALAGALVGKGARRNVKDVKGRTAVELARELGLLRMVELLLED